MKKSIFFAAAVLLAVGCQKSELLDNTQEQKMITHTFSVDDEATKSLFDPSDGYVKLDKTESVAVGCAPITSTGAPINEIVEAKRSGDTYSFTHTADATATGYNYFFVMPYRGKSNISTNGDKDAMFVKIDGVQHPTATSFDPLQDYIIGEPVLNATEQQAELSSTDLRLKRLFSPLRITLRDGADEFKGDPLMSVSIGFPMTDNKDKKNNLATLVYLKSTKTVNGNTVVADFSEAGPSGYAGVDTPHVSPTVTAEYSDGLAMDKGAYTVWYVTLPVEKAAGTVLTVTAQSKNRKVTREIKLPSDMKLKAGVINDLKINITGDGYVAEDTADPNDYWSIYNAGQNIVMADGSIINNTKWPSAVLLEGDEATKNNLQQGGLIFLGSDVVLKDHLKFGGTKYSDPKQTILIGRYKDKQPKISIEGNKSVYFENGNTIVKNISFAPGTANQIFVTTNNIASDIDYAIVEDCTIAANKHVYCFTGNSTTFAVKKVWFENCIINMYGTDNSYTMLRLGPSNEETVTNTTLYDKINSLIVNNCVIYAAAAHSGSKRRMIVDYGSNSNSVNKEGVRSNYILPTNNLDITVTNNTLYNINANGNILVRANVANNATVNNNVVYTDLTSIGTDYKKTYVFGLYNALDAGTHSYKVRENYSYTLRSNDATVDPLSWKYTSSGPHSTYNVGNNTAEVNKGTPFLEELKVETGYFPINTSIITTNAGASYDTKPWVK